MQKVNEDTLSIEALFESFDVDFDAGTLWWKKRPRTHFDSDRGYNLFNSKFPGREAITTATKQGYEGAIRFRGRQFHLQRGRVVWAMAHSSWPRICVGRHNGDVFDNRLSNLREMTKSQQSCFAHYRNKTGVRGVQQVPSGNFRAEIMIQGKRSYLGTFTTLRHAHRVRDNAALRLHGEFARITNPDIGAAL